VGIKFWFVADAGTLRDLRRALEQKEAMPASVDQTALATLAPVDGIWNDFPPKQLWCNIICWGKDVIFSL
jgi:hypothetical protein